MLQIIEITAFKEGIIFIKSMSKNSIISIVKIKCASDSQFEFEKHLCNERIDKILSPADMKRIMGKMKIISTHKNMK